MAIILKYNGIEAFEMIKEYYPETWENIIENAQEFIQTKMIRYNQSPVQVYKRFVIGPGNTSHLSKIALFAATHILHEKNKLSNAEKAKKILELDDKRHLIKQQIIALESDITTNYEDKKILRSYYNKLREKTNKEYNELINSFEVIQPTRIVIQAEIFGSNN